MDEKIIEAVEILKVLSHKERLKILCFIWNENKNVSDIVEHLWISQSQTSQFLIKMKDMKLIENNKLWTQNFYKVSDEKVLKIIESLRWIYCN